MLNNLPKRQSHKSKKTRLGRGVGSGHGGHTATRGQKGQKSRAGHKKLPWHFEGGQLPLVKRLPHIGGFNNINKKNYLELKTSQINKINEKSLNPKILVEKGVFKKLNRYGVKVLFDEPVKVKVTMSGFKYSKQAKESIDKAGGVAN